MKKASIVLFVLFFSVIIKSFAQTATTTPPAATSTQATDNTDFFAGKWEIQFIGIPQGDTKLNMALTRKDGVLNGDLVDPSKTDAEKIPLTKIEEEKDKIIIYFTAQGYDVSVDLSKVDNDNLKGMLMNMFESKATRIKE